jgi:ribosomal protein S2
MIWIKYSIAEMIQHAVHLGADKRFSYMEATWYFKYFRGKISIMNIFYTYLFFKTALDLIYNIILRRGMIFYINHWKVMSELTEFWAKKSGQPFSNIKWFIGSLTNIKVKIMMIDWFYARPRWFRNYYYIVYGSIKMKRLPDAIFITTSYDNVYQPTWEANILRLPVVTLIENVIDTSKMTLPIASNVESVESQNYLQNIISKDIILGKYICLLSFEKIKKNIKDLDKAYSFDYHKWWRSHILYGNLKLWMFRYLYIFKRYKKFWWNYKYRIRKTHGFRTKSHFVMRLRKKVTTIKKKIKKAKVILFIKKRVKKQKLNFFRFLLAWLLSNPYSIYPGANINVKKADGFVRLGSKKLPEIQTVFTGFKWNMKSDISYFRKQRRYLRKRNRDNVVYKTLKQLDYMRKYKPQSMERFSNRLRKKFQDITYYRFDKKEKRNYQLNENNEEKKISRDSVKLWKMLWNKDYSSIYIRGLKTNWEFWRFDSSYKDKIVQLGRKMYFNIEKKKIRNATVFKKKNKIVILRSSKVKMKERTID